MARSLSPPVVLTRRPGRPLPALAFSRSVQEPQTRLAPSQRRTPPGQQRGQPPGSSRERRRSPVSMPSDLKFRRLNNDPQPDIQTNVDPGALERLPGPHLTRSSRAFSLSLTTTVFSQRSTGWFDANPRRADTGGPTSLHLSHSTALWSSTYIDLLQRS